VEKEYEGEMREKDDEVMGLKERIKRTEIELKAALERYEELKNQDTRSRGYSFKITSIFFFYRNGNIYLFRIGIGTGTRASRVRRFNSQI
jgi:hypothetical protein